MGRARNALHTTTCAALAWLAAGCAQGVQVEHEVPPPDPVNNQPDGGSEAALDAAPAEPDTGAGQPNVGNRPDAGVISPADAGEDLPDAAPDASDGGGADAGTTPPDSGLACPEERDICDGRCVDPLTDRDHCGACGNDCGERDCNQGQCAVPGGCRAEQREGHEYLFCSDQVSWSQARRRCLDWALDLIVIDGEAEHTFATPMADAWIGLNDLDEEGDWFWVPPGDANDRTGAALSFQRWNQGQPDNARDCILNGTVCFGEGENCAQIRPDGAWNDLPCDDDIGFVCESF